MPLVGPVSRCRSSGTAQACDISAGCEPVPASSLLSGTLLPGQFTVGIGRAALGNTYLFSQFNGFV